MSARIHSHGWHCPIEGCCGPRSQGAGYGSESAASRARKHHIASAHPSLIQRAGVTR